VSHVRPITAEGPLVPPPAPMAVDIAGPVDVALERKVQNALNLYLPLKSPAQMPALFELITAAQPTINDALASLRYVHFARFLPSPEGTHLMTITTYDGGLNAYIMDFVAVLGDVFNELLQFIKGAPPLPVQRHPRAFVQFVRDNNQPIGLWSAYPELSVIEIKQARR
jgi:hypothetical protein